LAGELTKQIVGTASGGIIHVIWREKGHMAARDFLSNLQKVVNCWLMDHGFTVGVQDAVATFETKQGIENTLHIHKRKVSKIINLA
jgi:DNA-directed RNA polymerase II subunit RPB1